ncbi:hypothetical protein T265_10119 [Opisthorchis viverrini]|uniref:Proteasome assembly chaperone 2 n=1 Tax=Opisthorchis viverrini TaxID=6198 RepID=A0A074Z7L7_OPIVI|nr:hypothetical protein T265_10119 [Opisthorchis viverrini]KER21582.1 hypothetical protein T265_10119 [Opisthorchis viverrini]
MSHVVTIYRSKSSDLVCNAPSEWKDFTVFVACVGVGNVGQLACDLLIHNLNCVLAGSLDFACLPAVVGPDPFSSSPKEDSLLTCSQIYTNNGRRIAILQIRAPPFSKCQGKHTEELAQFLFKAQFSRVILLSSSFAMQRKDAELMASPLRYAITENFNIADVQRLKSKQWPVLLEHTEDLEDDLPASKRRARPTYRLLGCGIASRLFDRLSKGPEGQLPVCLLNIFASEGDNAGDALYMVHQLSDWLVLLDNSSADKTPHEVWLPPPSWSLLYGTSALESLY